MKDWQNQILEERGRRKPRYYAETCYLHKTDQFVTYTTPSGETKTKQQLYNFSGRRLPKALEHIPNGTRIKIVGSFRKWNHNHFGGDLLRVKLIEIVEEAPAPGPKGPSAEETLKRAFSDAEKFLR